MLRHVPVILMCCLTPSWARAQGAPANTGSAGAAGAAGAIVPRPQFTVGAASAGVYQFPTTASPVIGSVSKGTVLDVARDLGSWVRVPWPAAPDAVAYVHVSMGSMTAPVTTQAQRSAAAIEPARPMTSTVDAQAPVPITRVPGAVPLAPASIFVPAPMHRLGLGGSISGVSSVGFGATARAWRRDRLGIQFELSRDSFNSAAQTGHVTSMLYGVSALYSMRDRVSDYYSLRPYVGGGGGLQRQTLKQSIVVPDASASGLGVQTFGGAEVTFASVPQIGVSIEAGYRWSKKPFPGFEVGGFRVAASGHWYIR